MMTVADISSLIEDKSDNDSVNVTVQLNVKNLRDSLVGRHPNDLVQIAFLLDDDLNTNPMAH